MRTYIKEALCILALTALFLFQIQPAIAQETKDDLVDTAIAAGQFKTLVAAVQAAGLEDTLRNADGLTIFAPTDAAFAKLPKGTVENLLKPENREKLAEILTYHAAPGRVTSQQVKNSAKIDSVMGASILISDSPDGIRADRAKIIKADIPASNGIIHVIDSVILPKDLAETAAVSGQFDTLLAAAKTAGLAPALKNPDAELTIFAPTDSAFAALPKGMVTELLQPENREKLTTILKYHILPEKKMLGSQTPKTLMGQSLPISSGGSFRIGEATVVLTDIKATNGVIHVIDKVLVPEIPQTNHFEEATEVIDLAIARGVPLFNHGDPSACAAIYEVTARSLLSGHNKALDSTMRQRLQRALAEAENTHSARSRAWVLRHALDDVRDSLQAKMQMG